MAFNCTRLQRLEEARKHEHCYLDRTDECYFLGEYTAYEGHSFSEFNSLIFNLKKSPSTKNTRPDLFRYKVNDIQRAGSCLRTLIEPRFLETIGTVVPMPPSKTPSHPEYDDRMLLICEGMVSGLQTPDLKELLLLKEDTDATHNNGPKPPPQDLMRNMRINADPFYHPRSNIVLVDDVLTTGSHFKACKMILQDRFPSSNVIGVFVARRVFADKPWPVSD